MVSWSTLSLKLALNILRVDPSRKMHRTLNNPISKFFRVWMAAGAEPFRRQNVTGVVASLREELRLLDRIPSPFAQVGSSFRCGHGRGL